MQEIPDCNILFLSRDEARARPQLSRVYAGYLFLQWETTDFLSDGGMIRFHLEEGKIRFDINLGAADSSHLKISSRCCSLATR